MIRKGDWFPVTDDDYNTVDNNKIYEEDNNNEVILLVLEDENGELYLNRSSLVLLVDLNSSNEYIYNEELGLYEITEEQLNSIVNLYEEKNPTVKLVIERHKFNSKSNIKLFLNELNKENNSKEQKYKNNELNSMLDDDEYRKYRGIDKHNINI